MILVARVLALLLRGPRYFFISLTTLLVVLLFLSVSRDSTADFLKYYCAAFAGPIFCYPSTARLPKRELYVVLWLVSVACGHAFAAMGRAMAFVFGCVEL